MIKFIRKASDPEQIKDQLYTKDKTARNVMLSNCTKLQTFHQVLIYGRLGTILYNALIK